MPKRPETTTKKYPTPDEVRKIMEARHPGIFDPKPTTKKVKL